MTHPCCPSRYLPAYHVDAPLLLLLLLLHLLLLVPTAISMLLPGRTNRAVKNLFVGNLKCGARLNFRQNR
jgi:hypothetical protein